MRYCRAGEGGREMEGAAEGDGERQTSGEEREKQKGRQRSWLFKKLLTACP